MEVRYQDFHSPISVSVSTSDHKLFEGKCSVFSSVLLSLKEYLVKTICEKRLFQKRTLIYDL